MTDLDISELFLVELEILLYVKEIQVVPIKLEQENKL